MLSFSDDTVSAALDGHILLNRLDEKQVRLSIHIFRSLLLIITSIAILAVDFQIVFPVDLRKSSYYGISLMDVGVGFFILGSSMRIIRNGSVAHSNSSTSFKFELRKFPHKLCSTFKGSYLILLIGLIKLVIMKSLHYGSIVGEYGVHWNFFFSLFLVRVSRKLSIFKILVKSMLTRIGFFNHLRVVHKKERCEITDHVSCD
jgi:phosphatidylinositol glycan class W